MTFLSIFANTLTNYYTHSKLKEYAQNHQVFDDYTFKMNTMDV